jgi:hypothetical protein
MEREPVIILGAIDKAVNSVLAMLVVLGAIHLTADQIAAMVVAINAVLGIPLLFVARRKTTPLGKTI